MVPHPGASPYPRHGWTPDDPMKPPGTPDFPGPQPPQAGSGGSPGDQVFSPNTSGGAGSAVSSGSVPLSPDPYAFSPQQQPGHAQQGDPFSPSPPMRPGQQVRPQLRLPGLQAFGASSPREDESGMFPATSAPGMSPRVRPGTAPDMFPPQGGVPSSPGQDMMGGMAGPVRRMQGMKQLSSGQLWQLFEPLVSPVFDTHNKIWFIINLQAISITVYYCLPELYCTEFFS